MAYSTFPSWRFFIYPYSFIYNCFININVNYTEAIKYYKIAIENGSKATIHTEMLRKSQGVDVYYKEVIKYYQMAIDKGRITPKVMNNYVLMLENGEGTDYNEATKYYKMSLNSGYKEAFVNYANMIFISFSPSVSLDKLNCSHLQ